MGGSETLSCYSLKRCREALAEKNPIKFSAAGIVPHIMGPHMLSISVLCSIDRQSTHSGLSHVQVMLFMW